MNILENTKTQIDLINQTFIGSNLNKIQQLTEYDFLLTFSKGHAKSILISINLKNPFIRVVEDKYMMNQNSSFLQHFKAKLLNSFFIKAELLNNDNIVGLYMQKTTATYDKIAYLVVIELFKTNANIIILNDNRVQDAFRFRGLDTHHPILNNIIYSYPEKKEIIKEYTANDRDFQNSYLINIENQYLKEKYKTLNVLLKRKLKSLKKKLEKLQIENDTAKEKLNYKEYGDFLLTNLDTIHKGDENILINGKNIPLKVECSPSQNLEYFYKTYKKAKLTITASTKYYLETKDEIEYIESIIDTSNFYKEEDYLELINDLSTKDVIKIPKEKNKKKTTLAYKPYFVIYNNVKYGYGKNSKQNNELTFNIATKKDYFLHINKDHGPHVIIFKDNPTNKEKEFGCELALYMANKMDGDVVFTKISNTKKGHSLGQVLLTSYETFHINKVRDEMKNIISTSSRF